MIHLHLKKYSSFTISFIPATKVWRLETSSLAYDLMLLVLNSSIKGLPIEDGEPFIGNFVEEP